MNTIGPNGMNTLTWNKYGKGNRKTKKRNWVLLNRANRGSDTSTSQ